MTIPHTKYGHSLNTHFRYLSCLLDRDHIKVQGSIHVFSLVHKYVSRILGTYQILRACFYFALVPETFERSAVGKTSLTNFLMAEKLVWLRSCSTRQASSRAVASGTPRAIRHLEMVVCLS